MHARWGAFRRYVPAGEAVGQAERAMRGRGYSIRYRDGYTVIGGDDNVLVQATAVPESDDQVYVIVSAYASDPALARRAADAVRIQISEHAAEGRPTSPDIHRGHPVL